MLSPDLPLSPVQGLPDPSRPEAPSLPPELIIRIVRFASPPQQLYLERLVTLCACSLVRRSWRDIAQRELFRSVAVEGPWQVTALLWALREIEGGRELATWVVELAISGWTTERLSALSVQQIMAECPDVTTLHLARIEGVHLSSLGLSRGPLHTLKIEDSSIRVPRYGDSNIYPAVRHLGVHACNFIGLSSQSDDYPLGQLPNLRWLSLSAGEQVRGDRQHWQHLLRQRHEDIAIPTHDCLNLFTSFSSLLRILSVDSKHTKLFRQPSARIPLSSLLALDLTPSEPGHTFSLVLPALPSFDSTSTLTSLRVPVSPQIYEPLKAVLLDQTRGTYHFKTIFLLPLGPPYNLAIYNSPACQSFATWCAGQQIQTVFETVPSTASPFVRDGFGRFACRVEMERMKEEEKAVGNT